MPHRRSGSSSRRLGALVAGVAVASATLGGGPVLAGEAGNRWQAPADATSGRQIPQEWIDTALRYMTLEEKVGQLFVTYAYGDSVDTTDPDSVAANQETYGVDNAKQLIDKYKLGGVIYFAWSGNVNDPEQIAGLSNGIQRVATAQRAPIPMLISTDQEYGVVTRVGPPATQFPGSMALGAGRSAEDARTAAAIGGEELRAMGINQNFAPIADVNVNALNPVIGVRSFGEDPALVADMVAAQVEGYQSANVAATAKHFPGHGDTDVDSHTGIPIITHTREEWEQIDRPPFQAAVDQGVDAIMTAHIVVPALDPSGDPATLSKPIVTGVLREELGYDGLVITDALTMAGVREKYGDDRVPVLALQAGVDQLLMPPDLDLAYTAVLDAVRSGELTEKRIDESVARVLRLKLRRGLFDPFVDVDRVGQVVGTAEHLAAAQEISDDTVTLVKNDDEVLPLTADSGKSVLVTGAGVTGTAATLAERMAARGVRADPMETGTAPTDAEISAAVEAAQAHDLTVVTTNKAWTDPAQQQLVKQLVATGKPVVVAAVRDPYDIAYFTEATTFVATYSYTTTSLESLTRVLFGEVDPHGKLPVTIPVAGQPDAVLYPYGHGLRYGAGRTGKGVRPGIAVLAADRYAAVRGEKVGIITNPTGVLPDLRHEVDVMAASDDIDLVAVFGPEHGFRGTAQAGGSEGFYVDERTGLPVYDTYGKTSEELAEIFDEAGVDTVMFDIQDAGARFYTYIWTMYDSMKGAALADKRFVVLDRPNPITGLRATGPVLEEEFSTFVGLQPISQQHGMTVGELAQLFNAEFLPEEIGQQVDLDVVEMRGWTRDMTYHDTGLPWVMPSPNMPTVETAFVYPGTGMFEGTNLSEGRGTTRPFELVGAPYVDYRWAEALNALDLPGVSFREAYFTPTFSKYEGESVAGVQVYVDDPREFDSVRTGIAMLVTAKRLYPEDFEWRYDSWDEEHPYWIDKLTGSTWVRTAIDAGKDVDEVVAGWQEELEEFRALREKYLLYDTRGDRD